MRGALTLTVALMLAFVSAEAQSRRPPRRPPPKPAPIVLVKSPADATCPSVLGTGVGTKVVFCDVTTERDPAAGILVRVPPHRGPATLTFDLHNRHTYSEDQVRARKAYTRYTATVAVLAPDGTLIDRGLVESEFRTAADLVDRVGAGPGASAAVKAVAPTGRQAIVVSLPESLEDTTVSIVGEKLTLERMEGTGSFTAPGRPIAIVSNIQIELQPAPPPRRRK